MRPVPWWAALSASAAPVVFIGGWTIAAERQPGNFNSVRDTISALAGLNAADRWIMTTALAGVGVCHLVTALGLRPAALPGRLLLAAGGIANLAVAALPLPAGDGSAPGHARAATVGFVSLAIWPAFSWRRKQTVPLALSRPVALTAAAVLVAEVIWFATQLYGDGDLVGLTERVVAGSQAIWPLAVVISARMAGRSP